MYYGIVNSLKDTLSVFAEGFVSIANFSYQKHPMHPILKVPTLSLQRIRIILCNCSNLGSVMCYSCKNVSSGQNCANSSSYSISNTSIRMVVSNDGIFVVIAKR